jgi:hypothetical protein
VVLGQILPQQNRFTNLARNAYKGKPRDTLLLSTQLLFPIIMPTQSAAVFHGTIPALMTPCTSARKPDFDALVRMGKKLVADGMSSVVYCGSMGDWPLLSDEERMEGVERLTKAGVPVVVGTGAQSPARAAALAAHAKKWAHKA